MASTSHSHAGAGLGTALVLARRSFRDARVRTIAFVYLFALAASVLLLALSAWIALWRDIGTGTLPTRDSAAPRLGLLCSPTAQALRSERTSLLIWASGVGVFALPTQWLVDLTPFAHVGLVPAQPFRTGAAALMLAVATGCALAATWIFRRRDLTGQ